MISNTPELNANSMPSLPEVAGYMPDGLSEATMLIAHTKPRVLNDATHDVVMTDFMLELKGDIELETAQIVHAAVMRGTADEVIRTNAINGLTLAAQKHQDYKAMRDSIAPKVALAREVQAKQYELSRPLRFMAGMTLALGLGGAATAITYEAKHYDVTTAVELSKDYNRTARPGYEIAVPDGKMHAGDYALVGFIGVVGTVAGGSIGTLIGDTGSGRFARFRAKRQINRAIAGK